MKKAFTLVEMLVVVGIIAALMAASIAAFGKIRKSADRAKIQELVSNANTALAAILDTDGVWPKIIRERSNTSDNLLDERVSYQLAKRGLLALSYDDAQRQTIGLDRCGVVSPWARDVIKIQGAKAEKSTRVPTGGTIESHTLRFAVSLNGSGIIEDVDVNGVTVNVRANTMVWSSGKDGMFDKFTGSSNGDDAYSWTYGQTENVK